MLRIEVLEVNRCGGFRTVSVEAAAGRKKVLATPPSPVDSLAVAHFGMPFNVPWPCKVVDLVIVARDKDDQEVMGTVQINHASLVKLLGTASSFTRKLPVEGNSHNMQLKVSIELLMGAEVSSSSPSSSTAAVAENSLSDAKRLELLLRYAESGVTAAPLAPSLPLREARFSPRSETPRLLPSPHAPELRWRGASSAMVATLFVKVGSLLQTGAVIGSVMPLKRASMHPRASEDPAPLLYSSSLYSVNYSRMFGEAEADAYSNPHLVDGFEPDGALDESAPGKAPDETVDLVWEGPFGCVKEVVARENSIVEPDKVSGSATTCAASSFDSASAGDSACRLFAASAAFEHDPNGGHAVVE